MTKEKRNIYTGMKLFSMFLSFLSNPRTKRAPEQVATHFAQWDSWTGDTLDLTVIRY